MTTVLVGIHETDLVNFSIVDKSLNDLMDKGSIENLFNKFPFTLYQNRKQGTGYITMQIPLVYFILYKGYGLIKYE